MSKPKPTPKTSDKRRHFDAAFKLQSAQLAKQIGFDLPPLFGQRLKVILTAWNTMVMLRWCQREGDTQVVLGSSAVLAA